MSRPDNRRRALKKGRSARKEFRSGGVGLGSDLSDKERYFEIFVIAILFGFGVYHSILYFGHQVVPNSDFSAFVRVGRELLSFQLPSSYKRAPVVGLLQVCLSQFIGGQHPDLTAGRLLNAILHPFCVVLFYLTGKRIVGRSAVWPAVIMVINPWVLRMLSDPVAETTLLFFILLTFYFIFKRSSWCYLFASVTTMVRYEGAALILAAFMIDMIEGGGKKERIRAFIYAAVATVPLALWMLGTVISWRSLGDTHYLKELGVAGTFRQSAAGHMEQLWLVIFYSLIPQVPKISRGAFEVLLNAGKILAVTVFVFGVGHGLYRRKWIILALLIFLVPYVFVHMVHSVVVSRYYIPIQWILLFICFYGLQSGWELIDKGNRIPRPVVVVLQVVLLVLVLMLLVPLVPYLPKVAGLSRRSVSVPYVAGGVVAAVFSVGFFVYKGRYMWRDFVVLVLMALLIVSNQFMLVRVVRDGQGDIEFKLLADWYIANSKPGEKLLTTMPHVVRIFAPEHKKLFLSVSAIKAEDPYDFVEKCYEKDITYVAWDSRLGLNVGGRYYKLWGVGNIAALAKPETVGPYEFVTQIGVNERQFINIFRLHRRPLTRPGGQ